MSYKHRKRGGVLQAHFLKLYVTEINVILTFFFTLYKEKKNPTLTFFAESYVWVVSDFSVSLLGSSVSRRGQAIVGVWPWDDDDDGGGGHTHS